MPSGELTVTGKGSTHILLEGFPHDVTVRFIETNPIPCHPHHPHHDHLKFEIEKVDENPRHHHEPGHHHHNRQFYLFITWEVESVREIYWYICY